MSHPQNLKRRTIANRTSQPWWPDSSKTVSGKPGAVHYVKISIDREYEPDAYNIGINDGSAAGQTIFHLHLHVIPRYLGDRTDPRGGVRWLLPEKARYW